MNPKRLQGKKENPGVENLDVNLSNYEQEILLIFFRIIESNS